MQFSTLATIASVAAVANAHYNSTTTATATEDKTTLITITSCKDNACKETVSPALVSTATVTINSIVTEYTTWCPLTAEAYIASHASGHNATHVPGTHAPATHVPGTHAPATHATSTKAVESSTAEVSFYTGAAAQVLPAAGALVAGVAALLL